MLSMITIEPHSGLQSLMHGQNRYAGISHKSLRTLEYFSVYGCFLYIKHGQIQPADYDTVVCHAHPSLVYDAADSSHRIIKEAGVSVIRELKYEHRFGCATGSTVLTGGGNSGARNLIHAVTPEQNVKPRDARRLWESTYKSCMKDAFDCNARSLALPHLGSEVDNTSSNYIAEIAMATTIACMHNLHRFNEVSFVLSDLRLAETYQAALRNAATQASGGA